jgi:hypothetical protein
VDTQSRRPQVSAGVRRQHARLKHDAIPVPTDHPPFDPDDLLAFIDETGEESLSDPAYPTFGLGGCAIPSSHYFPALRDPWLELRGTHFPGHVGPLHASGSQFTQAQLESFGRFFLDAHILRLAALIAATSKAPGRDDPVTYCADTVSAFLQQLAVSIGASRIVYVLEANARIERRVTRCLHKQATFVALDGSTPRVPVLVGTMRKADCEPALK